MRQFNAFHVEQKYVAVCRAFDQVTRVDRHRQ